MLRVLVTGGAGYLGSVLCQRILKQRHRVRCFDTLSPDANSMATVLDHPLFELVVGSILELDRHPALLEGIDAVIHLAGLTSDDSCDAEQDKTDLLNHLATVELAERCLREGIRRFVFASSCAVYGTGFQLHEGSPVYPLSRYARSKVRAERKLLAMTGRGLEPVVMRQASLFGWSPRMRFDLAVNAMTLDATARGQVQVLGSGDQWRPFLHVSDSAEAFVRALGAPAEAVAGEVFNVGCDGQNYTVHELGEIVTEMVPAAALVETCADTDPRSYNVVFDKIQGRLGWRPRRHVRDGIWEVHCALKNRSLAVDSNSSSHKPTRCDKGEIPAVEGGQPLRADFLPFTFPQIGEEEEREVLEVLRSGWLATGARTTRFEDMLCAYTGAAAVVAVSSCTAALHLSLIALGVEHGDEVITTPITWPATANVIEHVGAKPVFVDVERDTLNMDPALLEEKITDRTRAILPVHMAGQPVTLDRIQEIAECRDLTVIEDAAHALGAEYRGRPIGSISRFTCFSFYPTKVITTGDGGAIALTRPEDAEKVRILANHGMTRNAWKRWSEQDSPHPECVAAGYKYNMTDLCAALGIHQVRRVDDFIERRRCLTEVYRQELSGVPELDLPPTIRETRHAHHLFAVTLRSEMLRIDRDRFVLALKQENIGTGIHFRGLHLQPFYREKYGLRAEELPQATFISDRIVSLPLYPSMDPDDARTVANAVKRIITYYRNTNTPPRRSFVSSGVPHRNVRSSLRQEEGRSRVQP
jgi:dTDP-4-amino-4,6-dideoxygalactose transaminase/nucleoside-diphosphate-sugar epimerase